MRVLQNHFNPLVPRQHGVLTVGSTMRALISVLALFSALAAAQAPLEFKDLQLGRPFSESGLVGSKLICGHDKRLGDTCKMTAMSHETIAGVEAFVMVTRIDNNVETIYVGFKESGYLDVRDALKEKYPELQCSTGTVQNRMGASFDAQECEIRRSNGDRLVLRQRSGNVDRSSLKIDSARAIAAPKLSSPNKRDL